MHVAVISLWYASGRFGPLTLKAEQREAMRTYTHFIPVGFGFVTWLGVAGDLGFREVAPPASRCPISRASAHCSTIHVGNEE